MKVYRFESKSSPGTIYRTTEKGSAISCSCPGFRHTGKCWHVDKVKEGTETPDIDQPSLLEPAPAVVSPMLASQPKAGQTIDTFNANDFIAEIKYDGHRLIVEVHQEGNDKFIRSYSRIGTARFLPREIAEALRFLPIGIYDGELRVPRGSATDVAAGKNHDNLEYIIFDTLSLNDQSIRDIELLQRRNLLTIAYEHIARSVTNPRVLLSPYYQPSKGVLSVAWAKGEEGIIVKDKHSLYTEGKRSPSWVKFKKLLPASITITGYESGRNGPYARVVGEDDEGTIVTVKTKNNDYLDRIGEDPNWLLGKVLIIEHQGRTIEGKYRSPMWDRLEDE